MESSHLSIIKRERALAILMTLAVIIIPRRSIYLGVPVTCRGSSLGQCGLTTMHWSTLQ